MTRAGAAPTMEFMQSTIVVAVRRNEPGARDAVALATMLARAEGARLVIAGIWTSPPHTAGDYDAAVDAEVRRDIEPLLRQTGGRLECEIVVARALSVPRGLHRVAVEQEADIVVLGPPAVEAFHRHAAPALVHDATFALALAPAGFADNDAVCNAVIGWDGSEESRAAVAVGRALAHDLGGSHRVVRAGMRWQRIGTDPGFVEQREGRPSTVLTAAALEDAAWIVVGSRGFGPVRRALFGSTTTRLLEDPVLPILVVPRGVRGATDADGNPAVTFEAT